MVYGQDEGGNNALSSAKGEIRIRPPDIPQQEKLEIKIESLFPPYGP